VKAVDAEKLSEGLPLGELYAFTPVATDLRFGKWREILAEPAPPKTLLLDTAVWTYARGFAHANTGDLKAAREDRAKLAALTRADFSRFEPFGVPAVPMTKLALALLDGEIDRVSGDLPAAVTHFRAAAELERALPYTEPPYWHQPVSHLLGAALLQAKQPAEAEAVYRESLHHYRDDGWALFGLALALKAQGKNVEANEAQADFMKAWDMADTRLETSRL
jgi:tetratricopeptide (TPR) repeat protein